jgi:hypothetical protein
VSGSFGTVQNQISTGTVVQGQVVTLPNAVVVEGTQGSFVQAACHPSELRGGGPSAGPCGRQPRASTLIAFLNGQSLNNLCDEFTLISPEALSSVFNAGVSLANVQIANLKRRPEDVRARVTTVQLRRLSIDRRRLELQRQALPMSLGRRARTPPP